MIEHHLAQICKGTTAELVEQNRILPPGTIGYATDTMVSKFGDGVSRWTELSTGGFAAPGAQGADGAAGAQGQQGIQGIQGPQGETGPEGPAGSGVTLAQVYPIGSIYMSAVATNPATLFGFGTWASFGAGRVPVGFDAAQSEFDAAEKLSGAKNHTLTTAEMPAHTHVQDAHNHTQNAHSHVLTELRSATTGAASTNIALTADTSSTLGTLPTGPTTAVNQAATATNQNTGGGLAHNNLQPAIVVFMWKRTA